MVFELKMVNLAVKIRVWLTRIKINVMVHNFWFKPGTSRKNELRHIHSRNMGVSRIFEFQLVVDKGNRAVHELIYIELFEHFWNYVNNDFVASLIVLD